MPFSDSPKSSSPSRAKQRAPEQATTTLNPQLLDTLFRVVTVSRSAAVAVVDVFDDASVSSFIYRTLQAETRSSRPLLAPNQDEDIDAANAGGVQAVSPFGSTGDNVGDLQLLVQALNEAGIAALVAEGTITAFVVAKSTNAALKSVRTCIRTVFKKTSKQWEVQAQQSSAHGARIDPASALKAVDCMGK